MVGAVRFELTTSWTRTKRASQATLRPDIKFSVCPQNEGNAMLNLEKAGNFVTPVVGIRPVKAVAFQGSCNMDAVDTCIEKVPLPALPPRAA